MSFFGSLLSIPQKAVRGIGRVARGKFKEGLGDIGSAAKGAAPLLALTGVGAPLALGIGAGGGALQGATDDGFGGALRGAAGGAANTGLALAARGIGSKILGGGVDAASAAGTPGVSAPVSGFGGLGEGAANTAMRSATQSVAGGATDAVPEAARGIGSRVLGFAKENPLVASEVVKGGLGAYGASQQGAALDREAALREEETRRKWQRQDNADPVLQEMIRRLLSQTTPAAA